MHHREHSSADATSRKQENEVNASSFSSAATCKQRVNTCQPSTSLSGVNAVPKQSEALVTLHCLGEKRKEQQLYERNYSGTDVDKEFKDGENITGIRDDKLSLRKEIGDVKNENTRLQIKVNELEETVKRGKDEVIEELKQELANQSQALHQRIDTEIHDVKAEIRQVASEHTVLEVTTKIKRQPSAIHIGWYLCYMFDKGFCRAHVAVHISNLQN